MTENGNGNSRQNRDNLKHSAAHGTRSTEVQFMCSEQAFRPVFTPGPTHFFGGGESPKTYNPLQMATKLYVVVNW